MTATTADTITVSLIALVVVLAAIVIWRVLIHDERIRKVRFGLFYERDVDDGERPDREVTPTRREPPAARSTPSKPADGH